MRSSTSTRCCTTPRASRTTIKNAICLHEEDNAVLWKHVDAVTGAEVRRQRRLVVSCHATVANYEYLVYWRFYQDGNIECEVRATGIMVTTPVAEGEHAPPYGTVVDNRTYAPFHQHFLVARLDLDVDGGANTVVEVDSVAPPSVARTTRTASPSSPRPRRSRPKPKAARDYDWSTQRSWKVVNPTKTNRHGTNVAYKLVPGAAYPAMMDPVDAAVPCARRSSATRCGSPGTTTTSAGRAAATRPSRQSTPA